MFNIGFSEALLIFFVALIVLGPKRLPEIGRFLGRISLEFKKAITEIKQELELDKLEKEIEETREEVKSVVGSTVEPLQDPLSLLDKYKTEEGLKISKKKEPS